RTVRRRPMPRSPIAVRIRVGVQASRRTNISACPELIEAPRPLPSRAMTTPVFEITKSAAFDAAHFIAVGPADSSYRRMHGHSFKVEATVRGQKQDPAGWVEDLGGLDAAL